MCDESRKYGSEMSPPQQCGGPTRLLVMIRGARRWAKELVALADGYRGSTESWADPLRSCRRRGMAAPVLAVGDGALGVLEGGAGRCSRPLGSSSAGFTNRPICLPRRRRHPTCAAVAAIKETYNADDIDRAQVAIKAFEVDYGAKYPKAVAKIVDAADELLRVLQVSGRALDPPENDESDRVDSRDRAVADQGHQGSGISRGRNYGRLQADRRRIGPLAGSERAAFGQPGPCRRCVSEGQAARAPVDITLPEPAETEVV